jgi:pyruvate dehydrogenase E1 component
MFDLEFKSQIPDTDPAETRDWLESIRGVIERHGAKRARYIVRELVRQSKKMGVGLPVLVQTDYINTISPEEQSPYPGNERVEKRIRRLIRWNAAVMVVRANHNFPGIGGHLSTYASAASLYEVGFNHFFKGLDSPGGGDQIFFQGHAAPGIYARAFLEGRLSTEQLEHFRRESGGPGTGLSSYPHPRLMSEFWQYPTVSMGLGPLTAIYQARFNRYLEHRGIKDTSASRVWAFLGDGECDEPEALGALHLASREKLDNLTFVINCNLQRLDGPVRGNGKIIQELERVFRGSGWNVIKVIWGREWDSLLARDKDGVLVERMNEIVDGQYQKYSMSPGSYVREHFFGKDPRLLELVDHLFDEDLRHLRRGGHDMHKLYAAYKAAVEHQGQPTVILAHTVKGWALGEGFEAKNVTHQMKKLDQAELRAFRNRLQLDIPDEELLDPPFHHPGMDSEEVEYMLDRRERLGGFVPKREVRAKPLEMPGPSLYKEFLGGTREGQEVSTTMAFARLLTKLIKDKTVGGRIVPIIPDEARTFGLDPLFAQIGIYSSQGQLYEPVDKELLLYYKESKNGQLLEEGITEAGSLASFTCAGTAHATHGESMIPFYIFYSMFGFQRVGDLIWAHGDARGRGFLMGATFGRTTLNGEGLQHEDGHSHILASTVPNCRAYDPAFAYEIAVIVEDGINRMWRKYEPIFYYITIQNETYRMPPMPEGAEEGILAGIYRFRPASERRSHRAQLFGSGSILMQVLRAQEILQERYDVAADVWSVTSYPELRREALSCERWNRLHPEEEPRVPFVTAALAGAEGPIVAASDSMKSLPDMISRWVPGAFAPLGTDGYGMSDTREALRRHFEMDAESIVVATLHEIVRQGKMDPKVVTQAIQDAGIDPQKRNPLDV